MIKKWVFWYFFYPDAMFKVRKKIIKKVNIAIKNELNQIWHVLLFHEWQLYNSIRIIESRFVLQIYKLASTHWIAEYMDRIMTLLLHAFLYQNNWNHNSGIICFLKIHFVILELFSSRWARSLYCKFQWEWFKLQIWVLGYWSISRKYLKCGIIFL